MKKKALGEDENTSVLINKYSPRGWISNLRFMILILLLVFYLLYTQMSLILHFPCSEKGRKKQSKSPYSSPPQPLPIISWYFFQPSLLFLTLRLLETLEYQDFFVRSDTVLLVNLFENFLNIFVEIYALTPARFLTVSKIAWKAAFKKTKLQLELLLLMIEKGIRSRICQAIRWYVKSNNKYMKDYDKIKNPHILTISK